MLNFSFSNLKNKIKKLNTNKIIQMNSRVHKPIAWTIISRLMWNATQTVKKSSSKPLWYGALTSLFFYFNDVVLVFVWYEMYTRPVTVANITSFAVYFSLSPYIFTYKNIKRLCQQYEKKINKQNWYKSLSIALINEWDFKMKRVKKTQRETGEQRIQR